MLQRFEPFNDLRQMQDTMDRMWRRFGNGSGASSDSPHAEAWAVPLDVVRNGEDTVIRASMPGVSPEDIQGIHRGQRPDHQGSDFPGTPGG